MDTDDWILNQEGLQIHMNEFRLKGNTSDEGYMIHVLNNLPKEYDGILDGLENHHTLSCDDKLTIAVIRQKLNHRNKCGKYSCKVYDPKCPKNGRNKKCQ